MMRPYPASDKAIELGCTCAPNDNRKGKGFKGADGVTYFWVDANCPLHKGAKSDTGGQRKQQRGE